MQQFIEVSRMSLILNNEKEENKKLLVLTSAVQLGAEVMADLCGKEIGAFDNRDPIGSSAELVATALHNELKGD